MLNSLDPEVLADALATKIDQNLSRELKVLLVGVVELDEIFPVITAARRRATVTLLTQLIVMLPDDDREQIVKLFKLRAE